MKKQLKTYNYDSSYNLANLTCVDLIVSRLTGTFRHANFYMYNYLECLRIGFMPYEDGRYPLKRLGIRSIPIEYKSFESAYARVKQSIDEGCPIYIMTYLNTLFYNKNYKDPESESLHCIGITGYDDEKGTVSLLEWEHISPVLRERSNNVLASDFTITEDDFRYICDNTHGRYESSYGSPFLFSLKLESKPTIGGRKSIVNQFIKVFEKVVEYDTDMLIHYVKRSDEIIDCGTQIEFYDRFRRELANLPVVLFGTFESCLNIYAAPKDFTAEYESIKERFLSERNVITNILIKHLMKKERLPEQKVSLYIGKLRDLDKELLDIVKRFKTDHPEILTDPTERIPLLPENKTDHAFKAKATADSSMKGHGPSKAVNGKRLWKNTWVSEKENEVHWLRIDFGELKTINKVRVYHAGVYQFNTYDYDILGSVEGKIWFVLCKVRANTENVRDSYFRDFSCRYVKLLIHKSCIGDNYARILELQAIFEKTDV